MTPIRLWHDQKGLALTAAIVLLFMFVILASVTLNAAYNKSRLMQHVDGKRIEAYYAAKAGIVDAHWRLMANYVEDISPDPDNYNFNKADWNPPAYYMDLDTDKSNVHMSKEGGDDVEVDIGPKIGGFRSIETRAVY